MLWKFPLTRGFFHPPTYIGKSELLNSLAVRHGYRHLIHIETRTTGHRFRYIDQNLFQSVRRLLYLCKDEKTDGRVDWITDGSDISSGFAEMVTEQPPDIIFLDSYHTYEISARDIEASYAALPRGGLLLIHDCRPPTAEIAAPQIPEGGGAWCGQTYRAYLDFVLGRQDLDWRTIDFDYGCGMIVKEARLVFGPRAAARNAIAELGAPDEMIQTWQSFGQDDSNAAFAYFHANAEQLARLVRPEDAFTGIDRIETLVEAAR